MEKFRAIVGPKGFRFAISTGPKVACTSVRHWMWFIATGRPYGGRNIYEGLPDCEYWSREELPESVGMVIAIHRCGVSRMRSVYDHRVRQLGEAEDRGIGGFARRLGDYAAHSGTMGHHMAAQHGWLGEEPEVFTDILPLDRLDLLPEMVGRALGRTLPPLPRIHEMAEKSEVSPEVAELFEKWCARDTELGWNGKTMKLSGIEDLGRRVSVPGWGGDEGLLIEILGVESRLVEVESSEVKPLNEDFLRRRRFVDYVRDWDILPERAWAEVASPWLRVKRLAESLRNREERFSGLDLSALVGVMREEGGLFLEGELDPQGLWLLDDRGRPQVGVEWEQEVGALEAEFDGESREWVRERFALDFAVLGDFSRGGRLGLEELGKRVEEGLRGLNASPLALIRPEMRKHEEGTGRALAEKYEGLKEWGWYLDDVAGWCDVLESGYAIKALEVGAFDGVSANLMLDVLFPNSESEVHCIDPYLEDPTTPQVSDDVREQFLRNRAASGREESIQLYDGLSVEVLALMIANQGYWESFDFIYIDGSHTAENVLTDAVMSWPLLKVGGVIGFDDYEWGDGRSLKTPRQAIDAFERIFSPSLDLLRSGGRKIWRKVK